MRSGGIVNRRSQVAPKSVKLSGMRFLLILWLLLVRTALAAESPPEWIVVEKIPYLTLEGWEAKTSFHPFVDPKTGRIFLERKGQAPLLLLLDAPYALQGGKFLALPQAPFARGGRVLLSAESAERTLLPLLPKKEREAFREFLQSAKGGDSGCVGGRNVKRIFLDPGHGGDDVGTVASKAREKDIVLKFSRLAADELRRRGFQVSFSRTKDVFLPLEIRPKLAKEWKADLFISIHVNSSPSPAAHGTETYILNQEATDAEARKLALLENSIAGQASDKASAVQDILWDMEQTAYLQESAYLASYIQEALVAHAHDLVRQKKLGSDWKNRGVRQAPFYVLNRAPMPAILVEIGYLSNSNDRKLMEQKIFQESLAKALAEGVKKYREACPKTP